jgi:hypothetical protein
MLKLQKDNEGSDFPSSAKPPLYEEIFGSPALSAEGLERCRENHDEAEAALEAFEVIYREARRFAHHGEATRTAMRAALHRGIVEGIDRQAAASGGRAER